MPCHTCILHGFYIGVRMVMRLPYIDYAKAIGIILVVYGHVARGLEKSGLAVNSEWLKIIDSGIYVFHMPLFFFLSGVFFKEGLLRHGEKYLLLSKVDSILYPFVIWSILQGAVEVFLSAYTNGNISWAEVFSFAWAPRAQFWFLHTLFLIFCMFTALSALFKKISAVWLLAIFIAVYFFRSYFSGGASLQQVSAFAVFFAAGILFSEFKSNLDKQYKKIVVISGIFFVFGQYGFHQIQGLRGTVYAAAALFLAFISIAFVMSLARVLANIDIRWLRYLGEFSMVIYLLHVLAGSGARIAMLGFFDINSVFLHLMVGVAAGLLVPLIALRLLNSLNINFLFYPSRSCSALHMFALR